MCREKLPKHCIINPLAKEIEVIPERDKKTN
jgi:hypothetical protein